MSAESSAAAQAGAFVPPDKFGAIEPGVFRSAFPTPSSFAHLRLLGLRTVVNLSQEALTRGAAAFLAASDVMLVDVGLRVWTHPKCEPISHELIKEAMHFVLDSAYHPLLVVSASGTHQVGALVGCLRRLQQWSLASTLDEYRCYASPSPRLGVEQFIELWDNDLLTLPSKLPLWFEQQQLLLAEDRERWQRLQLELQREEEEEEEEEVEEEEGEEQEGEVVEEEAEAEAGEEAGEEQAATEAGADAELEEPEAAIWPSSAWADEQPLAYFRVAGELVPTGTVTSVIDRDD